MIAKLVGFCPPCHKIFVFGEHTFRVDDLAEDWLIPDDPRGAFRPSSIPQSDYKMPVQISLFFRPYQLPQSERLSACVDVARVMDEAGIHSVLFGDHLLIGNHVENYPYGEFKHVSTSSWPDPIATLAAMAGATKRLRLSTGVLLAPLRAPLLLAKQIATLDVLSDGRTELAVGTGWQREEYDALGIPWEERYRRLDEGIRFCRAAWGEQPVTFESDNVKVERAWMLPRPTQERVPILFGVKMTPRNAQRIAELGDGWIPVKPTPSDIREGVDRLCEALALVGRDITGQRIRANLKYELDSAGRFDLERTLDAISAFKEAGANIFQIETPSNPQSMHELYQFIFSVGDAARRAS
jgi:probable F420-dependent oxidoreductase